MKLTTLIVTITAMLSAPLLASEEKEPAKILLSLSQHTQSTQNPLFMLAQTALVWPEKNKQTNKSKITRTRKKNSVRSGSFACSFTQCPKKFNSKTSLDYHICKVHTNERPYVCPHYGTDCTYAAITRSLVVRHLSIVHPSSTETPIHKPGFIPEHSS